MKSFVLEKLPKVYFGENCLEQSLEKEINNIGNNVLITYGKNSVKENGILDRVKNILIKYNKNIFEFNGIMSNPTYQKVLDGISIAKTNKIDYIIAIGGGSVIDASKIISAGILIDDDIWDLEFNQKKLPNIFVPMASIVTASGTGAEMNNKGVITNEKIKIKRSIVGAISDFVILDPTLTLTVPKRQMISGAFDTLSHLMETYFGKPLSDNISDDMNETLMKNLIKKIKEYLKNPNDLYIRGELMWVSSLAESSILMLGKVIDFQCHQIEHQLGAFTDCNHGEGLAVIHPKLYRHIYKNGITKFVSFAINVWNININTKNDEEIALAGIKELENFIKEIDLPTTFNEINIKLDENILKEIANSTIIKEGCMKKLSFEEIYEILKECVGDNK